MFHILLMIKKNFAKPFSTSLYRSLLRFTKPRLDITILCFAAVGYTCPNFAPLCLAIFGYNFAMLHHALHGSASLNFTPLRQASFGYFFALLNSTFLLITALD